LEQGLPEFSVCNLGHLVLSRFYDKETNDVNWKDVARACKIAVRLQDNVIDYTPYFLKENEKQQMMERRIGIGSMGLGTLLIKMGLQYGSKEGNEFTDKLYKFIAYHQYKASMEIAGEKGAFPAYEYEGFSNSGFMKRLLKEFPDLRDLLKKNGIRNVTINTQAPTGSTGTYIDNIPMMRKEFGGTTTGIEPYFSWEYWRAGRLGMAKQTVDLALDYMKEHGLKDVSELPKHFVTAMELAPSDHVRVQAAVQKWTDSSISKTANCPSDYTIEQTDELYRLSYQLGLKGMTIYRDGSRDAQVLATKEENAKLESHVEAKHLKEIKDKKVSENHETSTINSNKMTTFTFQKRPKRLYGFTEKVGFTYGDKYGKAYVTVNLNDGEPWEVFISTKVKEASSLAKALGLMTTKLLRLGAANDNLNQVIDTLSYDQTMGTLPAGLANILRSIQKEPIAIVPVKLNSTEAERLAETNESLKSVVTQFAENAKKPIMFQECADCGEDAFDRANCVCHACGSSKCN
jgi:ribonucleoside-diphosphate reductase alpha chain